jgi:hypothetical protein
MYKVGDKVRHVNNPEIIYEVKFADIMDKRTRLIMDGKMSIQDIT